MFKHFFMKDLCGFWKMKIYTNSKLTIFYLVLLAVNEALGAKPLNEYDPDEFQRAVLKEHNKLRKKHNVPPLFRSEVLMDRAMKCAQFYADLGTLATRCPWKVYSAETQFSDHPGHDKVNYTQFAIDLVQDWYSPLNKKDYDYKNPAQSKATLIVWKNTTELGFGMAIGGPPNKPPPKYLAVVALYNPPGNQKGKGKDNIMKPE